VFLVKSTSSPPLPRFNYLALVGAPGKVNENFKFPIFHVAFVEENEKQKKY